MNSPADDTPSGSLLIPAVAFEGAMAVLAVVVGWLLGRSPLESLRWSAADAGLGMAAALVPLGLVVLGVYARIRPLVELLGLVEETLMPIFRDSSVFDLALVAILAGLGEEMLFRPIVQQSIAGLFSPPAGPWIGLGAAALLFALAHWMTATYAVVAGLIGFYLGWLWMATGNLLVPIVTHAFYDFAVLVYFVRFRPPRSDAKTAD
jgi:membrane protease YdiL (CAAX protease family)